jgi:hypothetical protein
LKLKLAAAQAYSEITIDVQSALGEMGELAELSGSVAFRLRERFWRSAILAGLYRALRAAKSRISGCWPLKME